ncbi:mechanosensitive ion channel family protein [Ideonella sp. BN130291]|uniref:mechanosensitive ion channel family protein n=1 Tax=Ideonella sp. BN130291 TaxID=3112940 RepID=UPI002E2702D3|nr:mechanosensitive ion channel domain-containing protein [Ideonella sp. BN130291]
MLPAPDAITSLLPALLRPTAATEALVLIACLLLAWGVVRLLRGREPKPGSIWFGERVVDGVLFPVIALALAWGARQALAAAGVPIAVFKLALPILVSLLVIRLGVRVLRVAFPQSQFVRVLERTLSWLVWLWLALWLTGALPAVLAELEDVHWKVGGAKVTLRSIIEGTITAGLVLVLVLWVSAAIEARLLKGAGHGNLSLRKIAANAVRALLLFVGLLLALSAAGIDLTALSVLGGAVGVGLGFGLQKLASNYVSGFVILAERSLRIGDMVKVDGFEGRITDIATRYTVIRALNGRESIVPNELLITQRVENSSLADSKVLLNTVVQVAYGTDLDTLIPRLESAVREVPRVVADPGPAVQLSQFAADGLELTVQFWIADPENGQASARSAVNLQLLRTLNQLGVEIPFPQRVLHTRETAAARDAAAAR